MPQTVFALRQIHTNPKLREQHRNAGGKWVNQYFANVADGHIRVILSVEPVDRKNDWMHVSMSVCERLSGKSTRLPTDPECKQVFEQLRRWAKWKGEFEEDSEFDWDRTDELVRHFWNQKWK